MFIDDLAASSLANTVGRVVSQLVRAAADLATVVREDLHCKLALSKAQIVASTEETHKELRKALGKFAGPYGDIVSAKNLGIDFFGGALRRLKRHRVSQTERLAKLRKRNSRLKALKGHGINMKRLYLTGLQQSGHYGQEVVGVDRGELAA